MSLLRTDGIVALSGSHSSTSAQIAQGRAKAWINFNGTGTIASRDSFNVSSLVDNGTGDYTINLASPLPSADYAALATVSGNPITNGSTIATGPFTSVPTTSAYRFIAATSSAAVDPPYAAASIHGD